MKAHNGPPWVSATFQLGCKFVILPSTAKKMLARISGWRRIVSTCPTGARRQKSVNPIDASAAVPMASWLAQYHHHGFDRPAVHDVGHADRCEEAASFTGHASGRRPQGALQRLDELLSGTIS